MENIKLTQMGRALSRFDHVNSSIPLMCQTRHDISRLSPEFYVGFPLRMSHSPMCDSNILSD